MQASVQELLKPWGYAGGGSASAASAAAAACAQRARLGLASCFSIVVECGFLVAAAAAAPAAAAPGTPAAAHAAAATPKARVRAYLARVTGAAQAWCHEHWLSWRALKTAVSVRDQLAALACSAAVGLRAPLSSCGEGLDALRRALLASCGGGAGIARLLPGSGGGTGRRAEYAIAGSSEPVSLHPSSVLVAVRAHCASRVASARAGGGSSRGGGALDSGAASLELRQLEALLGYPEVVVYSELVRTSRTYMRTVTRVEPEWLSQQQQSH